MENCNQLSRDQLLSCVDLGKALTAELDPDLLLKKIMEKVSKLFPSETWSLLLLDEEARELRFELGIDLDLEKVKDVRLALGQGVAGHCAMKQELMVFEDVRQCPFFHDKIDELSGCRTESLVCVPILFRGRILGVLEMVNPKSIDKTDLTLLTLVTDYLAIGIENARRYREQRDMAIRDSLTGLYNQRYLYSALEDLIHKSKTESNCFSLIFMDIDDFKTVVDTEGHLNGSRALQEVATKISESLGGDSFGVAYGGDEFVVVLPDIDTRQAAKAAKKIRDLIKASTFLTRWGSKVRLTASFGVATFPSDARDLKELLTMADEAMFKVKTSGKDRVGVNLSAA